MFLKELNLKVAFCCRSSNDMPVYCFESDWMMTDSQ